MGVTIHVNGATNSLVHKGSSGFAMSTIPDVCKTPSPGGPVPIPYPVIVSNSSDLTKGTKRVKVDGGNSAAVKGSEFSRCNGDEAGTAGGIKSSTNMKEATWILYSFDVKMEGKNACRLTDKMMMNHGNTACLAGEVQPPVVKIDATQVGKDQEEACEKLEEKKVKDHDKAAEDAGMLKEDYDAIRDVCSDNNALVSFRDTNKACKPHLTAGVSSKGPDVKAHTGSNGLVDGFDNLTGDYDIHDMITSSSGNRIRGGSAKEKRLIERMNDAIPGDQPRVMHGAQANYGDFIKETGKKPNMEVFQPDPPITAFDGKTKPATVYRLETNEDIVNMYRCKGTNMPEEWDIRDKKTGKKIGAKIK